MRSLVDGPCIAHARGTALPPRFRYATEWLETAGLGEQPRVGGGPAESPESEDAGVEAELWRRALWEGHQLGGQPAAMCGHATYRMLS